jgi:hypothetical protein
MLNAIMSVAGVVGSSLEMVVALKLCVYFETPSLGGVCAG